MTAIERRLSRLTTVWPVACPACRARPVVVGIEPGEPDPFYPARCPACDRAQPPVVLVVGVDVRAI